MSKLTAVSLFSGAMGLDLGLEQAGFHISVALEPNKYAAQTIRKNRPLLPLIEKKIEDVTTQEILGKAQLRRGEVTLIAGGPSCQSFSTAGKRGSVSDPRGSLFEHFLRVVEEARPRFFLMENVKGILSAAIRHRPLNQRGPGFPPLLEDEELGSALELILKRLKETNYYIVFGVLNAADYGVPQTRERVIFLGSRDGEPIKMPIPTHAKKPHDGRAKWVSLKKAFVGLKDNSPKFKEFSKEQARYISRIPEGGNWLHLPPRMQKKAIGGAYDSWGGRSGFLRRLAWERPSPSLTTSPIGRATMLAHPSELRPLSIAEYARIQQFPDAWQFAGGISQQYIQIGNAVPVGLAKAIGEAIEVSMSEKKRYSKRGMIECADPQLLERLTSRPVTMLNPPRMWTHESSETTKEWLGQRNANRRRLLQFIDAPV